MKNARLLRIFAMCGAAMFGVYGADQVGVFDSDADIGVAPEKGSAGFNTGAGEYRVTGGGGDMWGTADAFHYVWKKVEGDVALTADVRFVGAGTVTHRKVALMIRQSLNPDSPFADAVLHGDGLTALQFRPTAAGMAQNVQVIAKADLSAPVRLRIERRGDRFTVSAGKPGEELTAGTSGNVSMQGPIYVGLAVSSHSATVMETGVFSNVAIQALQAAGRGPQQRYRSKISVFDLAARSTRTVYQEDQVYEAPNWSPDGKYLLSNAGGRLYRIPADGSEHPELIETDPTLRLNNDHGPSPDGRMLAFSASSPKSRQSQVYLASADGSGAHLMVTQTPSYFHGWSPDGKYLAYVLQHPGPGAVPANYDIFRVPAAGGEPEQLDSNPGYDDGPDYSPDGKWIYFNSDRWGSWDIWRIPAAGAGPNDEKAQLVTRDELEDWFPHPSPDGKWLLFLSFPKGTTTHNDKLAGTQLRMMPLPGDTLSDRPAIEVLATFFGGQGTINVNSWSPDSRRFAYVVYEPLPAANK